MAHISSRGLIQDATLWVVAPDGFGGDTFSAPTAIKCRWEERSQQFFSQLDSKETVSRAIVYVDRDVKVGDYLYPEVSSEADPSGLSGSFKVRRFERVPNLRNLKAIRAAYL